MLGEALNIAIPLPVRRLVQWPATELSLATRAGSWKSSQQLYEYGSPG